MEASFAQIMTCLAAGILVIVVLTTKFKVHAFFALFIAALLVGVGVGISFEALIGIMKKGFGHIMESLGFIIVLGTALGVILEFNGSTSVMANAIIRFTGKKRSIMAMNFTGFIVGLPIFCDSGYIVLSGLNNSVARLSRVAVPVISTSLAAGLYAVHCTIPPHPGAAAAAGILEVDIGKLIVTGILVALPTSVVGYAWCLYMKKRLPAYVEDATAGQHIEVKGPSVLLSFLPVVVPILLIALGSVVNGQSSAVWTQTIKVLGNPAIALTVGVILALLTIPAHKRQQIGAVLQDGAEKAGGILVIIGAGGAFGAVLAATHIGNHLAEKLPLASMGIFFPFVLTALIKTAQGSSTVAIITAASIIQPLLPALGLDSAEGSILCLLAMGGGSMMISHTNDAYFWVISKFSGIDLKTMLKLYSVATIWMGLTVLLLVFLLSQLWL